MEKYILFDTHKTFKNQLIEQLDVMKKSDENLKSYKNFSDYINICDWTIRRQEYNFTIDSFEIFASKYERKLKVLDIGCGVVPLCNYFSAQGHEVTALDPIKEDVDFLIENNLNSLYGTDVKHMHGYGEQLPFENESFDVVYAVSVLEHIPTGNDKIVLDEMSRVLKQDGLLILTTDVMPNDEKTERAYAAPFTSTSFQEILEFLSMRYDVDIDKQDNLLKRLDSLTWDDVHDFWFKTKDVDQREDDIREYLAAGMALEKNNSVIMSCSQRTKNFLKGENALIKGFYFYQDVASVRERAMIEKEEVIQWLISKKNKFTYNTFVKLFKKVGLIK
ncbi:class I SAM-dependent methyltransferase [Campylobacterota bacterium]